VKPLKGKLMETVSFFKLILAQTFATREVFLELIRKVVLPWWYWVKLVSLRILDNTFEF